jgi:hypothetical protein
MFRKILVSAMASLVLIAMIGGTAEARRRAPKKDVPEETKAVPTPGGGKALELGKYGDWGAYSTQGPKGKICYALAQPRERQPSGLNRDPGYLFISTRPGEGVRGEVSFIFGFPLRESGEDAKAEAGSATFDLITKGENAWVKNAAEEGQLVETLRKTTKLLIKAPSKKGNATTDVYRRPSSAFGRSALEAFERAFASIPRTNRLTSVSPDHI